MVRIGGGVFPDIKEKDYLGEGGYRVDDKAGKVNPQRSSFEDMSNPHGAPISACHTLTCRLMLKDSLAAHLCAMV